MLKKLKIDKVLDFFKKFKSKEPEADPLPPKEEFDKTYLIDKSKFQLPHEEMKHLDYDMYLRLGTTITETDPNKDKTLLFLDDQDMVKVLYDSDINKIKREYNVDITDELNIVNIFGQHAGYIGYRYIYLYKNKIDYAILDITLGEVVRLPNGELIELDGIDIAGVIKELNPNAKIKFCTAHTLDMSSNIIRDCSYKIEEVLGVEFDKVYMHKNSNRHNVIYEMIYK